MKRVQKIVVMIGVAAAVVGCRKAELPTGGAEGSADGTLPDVQNTLPISVTASTSTTDDDEFIITRTKFMEGRYKWKNGDAIGLCAFESADVEGLSDPVFANVEMINHQPDGLERTVFDGKLDTAIYNKMAPKDGVMKYFNYVAYYPQQAQAAYSNGEITGLRLSPSQTVSAADGYFPVNYDFMFSKIKNAETISQLDKSVDLGLQFKHLFSALKITITEDMIGGEKAKKIRIIAPEGIHLCGTFSISAQGEFVFTEPSNVVELTIEGEGVGINTAVYAIVNSVNLRGEDLSIEVETQSGFGYRCARAGKSFVPGFIHDYNLIIPKPVVTLNQAYTSYSYYAGTNGRARSVSSANSLNGKAIYTEGSTARVALEGNDGYSYTALGGGVEVGIRGRRISDSKEVTLWTGHVAIGSSFGGGEMLVSEFGQYDVQAYAKLGSKPFYSPANVNVVNVTGLPYNVEGANFGPKFNEDGWGANGGFVQGSYYNTDPFSKTRVYSSPFYIPAEIKVVVDTRLGGSVKYKMSVYAASNGSTDNTSNSQEIKTSAADYRFTPFTMTNINNRICLYEQSGTWEGSAMAYIHMVRAKYSE